MVSQEVSGVVKLTEGQEKEGYRVENYEDKVLVWPKKNQVALLLKSPDVDRKVQEAIAQRRKELEEVEKKTGWKAD